MNAAAERDVPPWLSLLLVVLCVLPTACQRGPSENGQARAALPSKQVKVARVTARPVERTLVALGSLVAHDQATLSAKVPGRVQSIAVDLGSSVRAGDPIAQIERRDYELGVLQTEAALAQARASLGLPLDGADDRIEPDQISIVKQARAVWDEAQANHDRVARLAAEGILAQSEVDTATAARAVAMNRHQNALEEARQRQAQVMQRRAELEIARQRLADTALKAPFDGAVQQRQASPGEFLAAGAPVITLVRMNPLRLRVEVPERRAHAVRLGQPVRLTVEGDSTIYTGEVKRLSPALDERSRMLFVEADVRNNGYLHPGAFARAEIVLQDSAPALLIPPEAIVTFAGLEKVFVAQAGQAVEKRITTGERWAEAVEVLSGLEAEETVVLDPGNLQGGQPIVVAD